LRYDDDITLRTAYVEGVATEPALQGRGYATGAMRALQAEIRDFDIAALSPFDVSWYSRLGWVPWRGPLFIRTESGLQPTPGETVMILRLARTPALDVTRSLSVEWRPGEPW
jgi:aminoglycoside 2'-N-acetyltransferase I